MYRKSARFLAIYITEAHARDEWPVGDNISCGNQPTTIQERQALAKRFVNKHNYQLPILLDNMQNEFHSKFAAWPFRFYIVHQGRIVHKAQPQAENGFAYEYRQIPELLKPMLNQL